MAQKISDKILNHLHFAKTANGCVGCRVEAVEDNMNKAWICVSASKHYDARIDPVQEKVVGYEVEYLELDKRYTVDDELDYDLFLVKKEIFYNLKYVSQMEQALQRWVKDFSAIEPISNVSHPEY